YVIIGNCAAGINAVEAIRDIDDKSEVTVISHENYPAYCRCLISEYLAGERQENQLLYREKNFYKKNKVNLNLGEKIVKVDSAGKKIFTKSGKKISYGKLLIATGARPKGLDIPGEHKEEVFGFRTLDEAKKIKELAKNAEKVLVFGGGLIGLKAAYALKKRGLHVKVIVKSARILSQVTDEASAQMMGRWLTENGIVIRTGLAPVEILGDKRVREVKLDNGEKISGDIVIVGKGVVCNEELVNDSGIETHWGIIADDYLKTSVPDIYVAGDVAETKDIISREYTINALWTAATEQGKVAGENMAGRERIYPGSMAANSIEFFNLPLISVGRVRSKDKRYEEFLRVNEQDYVYKKLLIKENRLVGVVLLNAIENAGVYTALIRRGMDISKVRDILLDDYFDYALVRDLLEEKEGFRESISITGELVKNA
ncbi:NAD(P)/FAD-dependent oxidoreductase, partial [Candidatus Aerophobetes bacterium]|nr:NAD(P)/FAD-dependent oxidoreductase [Candidatus Aerophobetes bacterium]